MKVLFAGLGSIGQRHLRNCKSVLDDTVEFMAFRTSTGQSIIEDGKMKPCDDLAAYYDFIEFRDLKKALEQQPDVGFVCNPSIHHVTTALAMAKAGSAVFIEKPLATSIGELSELEKIISEKKLITMVGYQSRFHPCIRKTMKVISDGGLGEVVSSQFNWLTYLPDHHPYEDYRNGYASRKDLGGGVTFCLSHELDLIQLFFDQPLSVYAVNGAKSQLQMDAEDTVSAIFQCGKDRKTFPVSLYMSFAQKTETRKFTILFQKGSLECDLHNNKMQVTNQQGDIIYQEAFESLQRNELFVQEIQHFFDCVDKGCESDINLSEGKKSVLMALGVHESIRTGNVKKIG